MSIKDADFGLQVGIGFVGRVVTMAIAFLGSIVLARALGPSNYGSFYLLMTLVMLLDNPVTGWSVACRKRFAEADTPSDEIMGAVLGSIALGSAFFAILGVVTTPLLDQFIGAQNSGLMFAALFAGSVTFSGMTGVLKVTSNFGAGTWMDALRDLVRVPAQIGLVVLASFGVAGMVGGMVLANLLVAVVCFGLIRVWPSVPSRELLVDVWGFAKSSIPDNLLGRALDRMDSLLLGVLATTTVVGYYEVAFKLTMPAMFVASVASSGLMAQISNRRSRDEPIQLKIENNLAYGSILALPLFFGSLSVGREVIVTAYGGDFGGAGLYITGLALFRVIRSQNAIITASINGFDRPDLNLRTSLVVFALNLTLGVGLFFAMGPIGVVVATVLTEGIAYAMRARYIQMLVPDLPLFPRPFREQLASGALMAVAVFGVKKAIPLNSWQNVLLAVGIGGGVYFLALLVVSDSFRLTIRSIAEDAGLY